MDSNRYEPKKMNAPDNRGMVGSPTWWVPREPDDHKAIVDALLKALNEQVDRLQKIVEMMIKEGNELKLKPLPVRDQMWGIRFRPRVKDGANINDIHPAIANNYELIHLVASTAMGIPLTITSGRDGQHGSISLHYVGKAIDIRTRYGQEKGFKQVDPAKVTLFCEELRRQLGKDFDVVPESDHVHLEYDPKGN